MNIKAIIINTYKEAVRNKIFYLFLVFGILFALSSRIIGLLTVGDRVKVLKDAGLASINFFCVLIAIFTGINLVYKEIEKKTIYTILSKPISREQFILGKFLGLALTMLVALASMGFVFFTFLLISGYGFDAGILLYFLLFYFELLILISLSLLFSSFSTPILASIFTISIYLIGQVTWTFNQFKELLRDSSLLFAINILYYILPNFRKFNIKSDVVLGMHIGAGEIFLALAYALFYIAVLLTLSILIFRKREFQ